MARIVTMIGCIPDRGLIFPEKPVKKCNDLLAFFQAGRPSASLHSYALADKMIEKVRSVTPNPKPFRSARATHTGVQDPGALINKSHSEVSINIRSTA
jgi:hypothetical protein